MKSMNVVHRDLKPQNILINDVKYLEKKDIYLEK
jgi:serine/threonine protein kinase